MFATYLNVPAGQGYSIAEDVPDGQ